MLMFSTFVYIKVAQQLSSQTIFRKHTFYYSLHQFFSAVRFSHQASRSNFALTARITGVAQVDFIIPLVSCKFHFVCIDDNNVITAVYMRGEVWFILTSQQLCNFCTEATYHLIGSIHYDPFFSRSFFVCRNGLVT